MKVLEELFYGNIPINEQSIDGNEELKEAMHLVTKNEQNVLGMLSDKQKEVFEKYKDSYIEMSTIWEKDIFASGFSLGLRLAFESMSNDDFIV